MWRVNYYRYRVLRWLGRWAERDIDKGYVPTLDAWLNLRAFQMLAILAGICLFFAFMQQGR